MKNLSEFNPLNESEKSKIINKYKDTINKDTADFKEKKRGLGNHVNLYIMNCGAMDYHKKEINEAIHALRSKSIVNINIFDKEGIHPVDAIDLKDVKFNGPHLDKWDDVIKETQEHLGQLSFVITC